MKSSNIGFVGNEYKWFIGQVPDNQNQWVKNTEQKDAWGSRVKVRIQGLHDEASVSNDNLPWAIIAKPTTNGNYNSQTSGVWGGEWVIGFFLDESMQIPIITHVLDKTTDEYKITESKNGTTGFLSVNRWNSGIQPASHHVSGGPSPSERANPSSNTFTAARTKDSTTSTKVSDKPIVA